jgi:hypothetical protein
MLFPKNDKYFDFSKTYTDKLDNIFSLIPGSPTVDFSLTLKSRGPG